MFDQEVDKAFLGAMTAFVVLADEFTSRRFGCGRVTHDIFEWGGACRDVRCPFDDESQLTMRIRFALRFGDPISIENDERLAVSRHGHVQGCRQDGVLRAEGLIDGGGGDAGAVSDGLHGGGDVAPIQEEPNRRFDDSLAGLVGRQLPAPTRSIQLRTGELSETASPFRVATRLISGDRE